MKVWEYMAIYLATPVKGEESTEVLLRKYPEDVRYSIIEECKTHKISVSDLLDILPYYVLSQVKKRITIEELMELNVGFIPKIILGGKRWYNGEKSQNG